MYNDREYGAVLRLDSSTYPPPNFTFVPRNTPTSIAIYCRTMTLAQGRILYLVWESWDDREVGYLVPTHIVDGAGRWAVQRPHEAWQMKPALQKRKLEGIYDLCVELFPRMPYHGIRRVAERMLRLRIEVRRSNVEETVVRYALRNWTKYWLKMEVSGVSRDSYLAYCRVEEEIVKEARRRLRDVLADWIPPDMSTAAMLGFWRRHDLLTEEEKREDRPYQLTYFGGRETGMNFFC